MSAILLKWFPWERSPRSALKAPGEDALVLLCAEGFFKLDLHTGKVRSIAKGLGKAAALGPLGPVLATYEEVFRPRGPKRALSGALAASARHVVLATQHHLHVLDPDTLADLRLLDAPGSSVAVAHDIAAVGGPQGVTLVDLRDGKIEQRPFPHVHSIALSPDGARLAVTTATLSWEGPTLGELTPHAEHGTLRHAGPWFAIGNTLLDENGPFAVLGSEVVGSLRDGEQAVVRVDNALLIVDARALRDEPTFARTRAELRKLAADDHAIAALDEAGFVTVWDAETRDVLVSFPVGTRDAPIAIRGEHLFVGTGPLEVWAWRARKRVDVWARDITHISALHVRGRELIVAGSERAVVLDETGHERASAGPWKRADASFHLNIQDADLAGDDALVVAREEYNAPAVLVDLGRGTERELTRARRVITCAGGEVLLSGSEGTFLLPNVTEQRDSPPVRVEIPRFDTAARLDNGAVWAEGPYVGYFAGGVVIEPAQLRDEVRAVAASRGRVVTATDLWVALRDVDGMQLEHVLPSGASASVKALAFDPSGQSLVVGEGEPRLHIWRLTGVPERVAALDLTTLGPDDVPIDPEGISSFSMVAFSPSGIVALSGRRLSWRDPCAIGGKPDSDVEVECGRALSQDGSRILSSTAEHIKIMSEDGQEILCLPKASGFRTRLGLSPDGRLVLIGEVDEATNLAVYAEDGAVLGRMRVSTEIQHVALDPFGGVIGWVHGGPCFRWHPRERMVEKWGPKKGYGDGIAFGAGTCVVWYSSGFALVLDIRQGRVLSTMPAPLGVYVEVGAISHDGALVALGDRAGATHLYRAKDGALLATFSGTADGGFWSRGQEGTRSEVGDAVRRVWRKA